MRAVWWCTGCGERMRWSVSDGRYHCPECGCMGSDELWP